MMMSASISVSDRPKHIAMSLCLGQYARRVESRTLQRKVLGKACQKALLGLLVYIFTTRTGKRKTPRLLGQKNWPLAVT
jgi:hypothetical protein